MVSKGDKRISILEEPHYPLSEVRKLIQDERIILIQRVRRRTKKALRWERQDIIEAILQLKPKDFYKRDQERKPPWGVLDIYKPKRKIKGELVYIHFFYQR